MVKVSIVNRETFPNYYRFKTFCGLDIPTNKGIFTFVFKEDIRAKVRTRFISTRLLTSYFVELVIPDESTQSRQTLKHKVVLIVCISIGKPNYHALANVLLDRYMREAHKL